MLGKIWRLASLLLLGACAGAQSENAGEQGGAWEAESVFDETKSTHLWIVDHAIEVLGRHAEDPVAVHAVTLLDDPVCRKSWQQGLDDADHKAQYNDGKEDLPQGPSFLQIVHAQATWASHFYDPDTGKNYKGGTSRTAFTQAGAHLESALANGLATPGAATACYELGLALHYFTDLTQPMHAANFTALSNPIILHANVETYAERLQDRAALSDWSGKPSGTTDELVLQTAKSSKAAWPVLLGTIETASRKNPRCVARSFGPHATPTLDPYTMVCWSGDADVQTTLSEEMKAAQDNTAKYIYLAVEQLAA